MKQKYVPPWKTKEWKEARKKWDNGEIGSKKNECEQYGCNSNKGLTPHHTTSFKNLFYNSLRKITIKQMCNDMGVKPHPSSLYGSGGFSCPKPKGYVTRSELITYLKNNPQLRDKAEEIAKKIYYSFKDTQTLCQRCHCALEDNKRLCRYCKEKYHYLNFVSCKNEKCMEKVKKLKEKEDKEYKQFEKEVNESEKEMCKQME